MDFNRRRFLNVLFAVGLWPSSPSIAKDGDNSGNGGNSDRDYDDRDDDDLDDDDQGGASSAVENGEIAPLAAIIRIALAHTPGKVIDVKLRRRETSYIYRIKILTKQNRKRELFIDARTRKVVRVKS